MQIKPYNNVFTIRYDALQHYYDGRCNLEKVSSLPMSALAGNNRGAGALKVL